ncbi:MAG: putative transcriptional regulator [Algoriphagus sp.]|jgi:predicted transcriptional regulator
MKNFQTKGIESVAKDLQLKVPLVSEYMVHIGQLITLKPSTPVMSALETLLDNRITGAPVVDDKGEVIGLFDDKDCLNILIGGAYYNNPVERDTVSDYMSNVMKTIPLSSDIVQVANTFLTTPYKRLLVVDAYGKPAGQISRRDILRAIREMNKSTW